MRFRDMKFDTPDNVCQSLRVLAEKARTGEITIDIPTPEDGAGEKRLRIDAYDLRKS